MTGRPVRLEQNKIVRYPGGREIDRFRGVDPPLDDGRPEAWVGSVTPTMRRPGSTEDIHNGCARCALPDGTTPYLFELIEREPEGMLGAAHVERFGKTTGFLIKLLDAQKQLGLQTHPTRPYAKEHFNSPFGKAESWYIIGLREDAEETPYVLLGFKEGVTREVFEKHFDAGDISAMERCCHKIPVKVGDVYNIEPGAPHAVGTGVFLVETQEPSDITVGARKLPASATPEEQERHKQRLLGSYNYEGLSLTDALGRYKIVPHALVSSEGGVEESLIGPGETPYFRMTRITATGSFEPEATGQCAVWIVLSGGGELRYDGGKEPLGKADELFLPATAKGLSLIPHGDEPLVIACAHPERL